LTTEMIGRLVSPSVTPPARDLPTLRPYRLERF
jgi:hypothetical protein